MKNSPSALRGGFTVVELLVVIGVIGVLVALLLPVLQSTRESARAVDCQSRIRQLALATNQHEIIFGYFPPARLESRPDAAAKDRCGAAAPTWLARITPYLSEQPARGKWDYSQPWYAHPTAVRTAVPNVFICPSRRSGARVIGSVGLRGEGDDWRDTGRLPCGCPPPPLPDNAPATVDGALSDFAGNHGDLTPGAVGAPTDFYFGGNGTGVIISSRPKCKGGLAAAPLDRIRLSSVSDGSTNTFLIGEKFIPLGGLGQFPQDSPAYDGDHLPASARLAGPGLRLANGPRDVLADMFSFGSWHPAGVHFAMVDGTVRLISIDTDTKVLGALANRDNKRIVKTEQ